MHKVNPTASAVNPPLFYSPLVDRALRAKAHEALDALLLQIEERVLDEYTDIDWLADNANELAALDEALNASLIAFTKQLCAWEREERRRA